MLETFVERGRELAGVRDLLADDSTSYPSSLALVSIHSAIAMNDAVQTKLAGTHWKGKSHEGAGEATETLCKAKKLGTQGVQHLTKLLSKKTPYSYGSSPVTEEQAKTMQIASERFQAWAEIILKEEKK